MRLHQDIQFIGFIIGKREHKIQTFLRASGQMIPVLVHEEELDILT